MKAIRLLEYGGQLVFNDVPTPAIARDEILVKIKSTAVNHLDLVKASGTARQILPIDLPWIPGHEFSGVIEQIGSDVVAYAPGDAVFAANETGGAYAEHLAVKPAVIARKPSNLSFEEAASVPVASQTAWQGLFTYGHLEKGQTILIHGGGLCGAIGIACRRHRHCHSKRRRCDVPQLHRSQPGYRLSRGAVREGSAREGRCGLRLGRWRDTEAVVPRLEGRWPSRIRRSARIAGRGSDAPCVGRDDAARAVRGRAQQNRATAGRGDNTTRRCDRVRTPRCRPGLEGHRRETAKGSWDVAQ